MMPKIVTICGSTKYIEIMAVVAWLIERDEGAIVFGLHLLPWWYGVDNVSNHLADHEGCAESMDALHLQKINLSDEIYVVEPDGYIGDSTRREIEHAEKLGITIRYHSADPIGEKLSNILLCNYHLAQMRMQKDGK